MSNKQFEIKILTRYCKGCGLCVEFCEQGKLYLEETPNERGVQPAALKPGVDCTGCLKCATICPDGAAEIYVLKEDLPQPTGK